MSGEKPSAEKPSGEAQSYYTAEPHAFRACKRMYALTLEQAAYVNWEQIHRYMCSRMKPVYALVCEHDGPDYPHIHCLYQYKNDKKVSGDRLFGAHIETKLKSPQAYQAYCKGLDEKHVKLGVKSTTLIEEGELKRTGGARTIGDVKKMSREEVDELPVQLNNVAEKIYEKERNLQGLFGFMNEIRARRVRKTRVIYAHGQPRSGKTIGGWEFASTKYKNEDIGRVSITNGFFKFENPEAKCFIIEEFRSSQLPANSWLQFTDVTGYSCPVKGGYQYCRPETIIVCSIINPQDLYSDEHAELKQQFIERITDYYEVYKTDDGKRIWQKCKWNEEDRYWQDTDDEPVVLDPIEFYIEPW